MPNHPRIWRREKLLEIGSYSEFLPICDDQEILLHTINKLNMLKIPKNAYIQYFNDGGSNFSLLRNEEINRLGPNFITPQFKAKYPLETRIKTLDGWHDPKLDRAPVQIWMQPQEFQGNYINKIYNPDYDKQYGIIGLEQLTQNMPQIKSLYQNPRNDFFLIDNKGDVNNICNTLMANGLSKIKFYILKDIPQINLVNYFTRIYKSTEDFHIFL
jgi:hypothetical protein